jgi:hypothetical protein
MKCPTTIGAIQRMGVRVESAFVGSIETSFLQQAFTVAAQFEFQH